MSRALKSFMGLLGMVPIAFVSAAACGGSAFESRAGAAGSSGLAGMSSAGTSASTGGSSSSSAGAHQGSGGANVGGAASEQGGTSSAGAVGHGGSGSGGHGGSSAHENAGGSGNTLSACTSNTECQIVPVSCCACSNTGPVSNFTAINSAYVKQYNARCETVDCVPCGPEAAPGPNDPYFYYVATCQRPSDAPNAPGHCAVVDLRQTEITACKKASDCTLRAGTACSSGCSGRPVALNANQNPALSDLVCPDEPVACPACVPLFDGYQATCTGERCNVALIPCTASNPCP